MLVVVVWVILFWKVPVIRIGLRDHWYMRTKDGEIQKERLALVTRDESLGKLALQNDAVLKLFGPL